MTDIETKEGVEQKSYEVAFLLRAESDVPRILTIISQHGLEITLEGPLKPLKLAYEIKKVAQAYFGFFEVKGLPAQVAQLEKSFQANPIILRSLILHIPHAKQQREAREEDARKRAARPREIRIAMPSGQVQEGPRVLSNEALEKKIEEILQ